MKLDISASGFTFVVKEFSCNDAACPCTKDEILGEPGGFVAAAPSTHALKAPSTPVLVIRAANSALAVAGSSQTVKMLVCGVVAGYPLNSPAATIVAAAI